MQCFSGIEVGAEVEQVSGGNKYTVAVLVGMYANKQKRQHHGGTITTVSNILRSTS